MSSKTRNLSQPKYNIPVCKCQYPGGLNSDGRIHKYRGRRACKDSVRAGLHLTAIFLNLPRQSQAAPSPLIIFCGILFAQPYLRRNSPVQPAVRSIAAYFRGAALAAGCLQAQACSVYHKGCGVDQTAVPAVKNDNLYICRGSAVPDRIFDGIDEQSMAAGLHSGLVQRVFPH